MGWLLIGVGVLIVSVATVVWFYLTDLMIKAGFAVGVLLTVFGNIIGSVNASPADIPLTPAVYTLRAIQTDNETTGQFFILAATVKNKSVYRFYQEDDRGRISMETLDADDVYLVEDGKKQVVSYDDATCHTRNVGNKWWSPFAEAGCTSAWGERTEIHIPKGSIRDQVDVDLPVK